MHKPSNTIIAMAIAVAGAAVAAACGGGGNTPPTTPGGVVSGSIGATVTLTANGASPLDVRIETGQRVRFVNTDTRPHQLQTNPHNLHTDCPSNNVKILNPGESVDSAIFGDAKTCGYHDHLLPDEQRFWGVVRVGVSDGEKGPVYSKGW
jgi:plastocyanin